MTSGDVAKNFKNEESRAVDLLSSLRAGARSPDYVSAMYLAREALQNSIDSSNDSSFREWLKNSGHTTTTPFRVTFRFVDIYGAEKKEIEEALGLTELRELVKSTSTTEWLNGSPPPKVIAALDKTSANKALRLLYIEEHCAGGMYGVNTRDLTDSKMILAMCSHNVSDKDGTGSGGSFGHGKSALAAASRVRMNVAYTSYGWLNGDHHHGLLGVSYYPMYRRTAGKKKVSGFGYLSNGLDASIFPRPFWDEAACKLAAELGFEVRGKGVAEQYGSTIMIVDPAFGPKHLEEAIADHWWPAICSDALEIDIVEEVRGRVVKAPTRRRVDPRDYNLHRGLEGFPEALESLRVSTQRGETANQSDVQTVWDLEPAGSFGAHIVRSSTRHKSQASSSTSKHIVAYSRGIGMVAFYRKADAGNLKGQREIRGVFRVSNTDSNELFRKSEPKTHDVWVKNAEGLNESDGGRLRDVYVQMTEGVRGAVRSIVAREQSSVGSSKNDLLLAGLLEKLLRSGSRRNPSSRPTSSTTASAGLSATEAGIPQLDESSGTCTWKVHLTHAAGSRSVDVRLALGTGGDGKDGPRWVPTQVTVNGIEIPSVIFPGSTADGIYSIPLTAAVGAATAPTSAVVEIKVAGAGTLSSDEFGRPLSVLWGERLQPEWRLEVVKP
jgi:hypothetical protein